MNRLNNIDLQQILDTHYENINNLSRTINESNSIIQNIIRSQMISQSRGMSRSNNTSSNIPAQNPFARTNTRNRNLFNSSFVNNSTNLPTTPSPLYNNNFSNMTRSEDENTYTIRFDALLPLLFDNFNVSDNSTRNDISYNIKEVLEQEELDISMASEIFSNYDMIDAHRFSVLQPYAVNDICPITRERIHNEQRVMMICACKHVFNRSSLNIWLRNNNTCPTCRCAIHQQSNE